MMKRASAHPTFDYYDVLGVSPRASVEEIRTSFRKLVLEFHPDKNPDRREWSEKRIRELIEAYDVLTDEGRRRTFDSLRRTGPGSARPEEPFFFRRKTPGARALLILHLMLHEGANEAVVILDEMEEQHGPDFLEEYLDRKDYLDCLFLLAEHFVAKKEYLSAVARLKTFYRLEHRAKYRRHYFHEVQRLLKDLYLRKLPKVVAPQRILDYLAEVSELQLTPQEDLLRLKRVAEAQARVGDHEAARETLSEIQGRDPNTKGLGRIEALLAAV